MKNHRIFAKPWFRVGSIALVLGAVLLVTLLLSLPTSAGPSSASVGVEAVAAGPWRTAPAGAQLPHLSSLSFQRNLNEITATGVDGGWGPDGVGGWSISHELTFSIYGGIVEGVEHYVSKIITRNPQTGQWEVVGSTSMDLDLTATYPGGLSGDFADTSLLGQGNGVAFGEAFSFVAVGVWEGHVEATEGIIEAHLEISYIGLPPYLNLPTKWDIVFHFKPIPGVDRVEMHPSQNVRRNPF